MNGDPETQLRLICRGAEEIVSEEELRGKLKRGRPLVVKAGLDPTASDLHLGHSVLLRKLKHFQELGHRIKLVIGDFTATIGDPSGRSRMRSRLSPETVEAHAETYTSQAFRILKREETEVVFNSSWSRDMRLSEALDLTAHYTVARMLERDDFSTRYRNQEPISLIEFFYPLLQGHDSIQLKADVELGGTDQKFNLLVGRHLMREAGLEPQVILTVPIIEGTDGTRKMSKTLDNAIGITEAPREMFGKLMSIPDALIFRYFLLLTDTSEEEQKSWRGEIEAGRNPRDAKVHLAKTLVSMYHGEASAEEAEIEFQRIFRSGGLPDDMVPVPVSEDRLWVVELIGRTGHLKTNGEIRRLMKQGGIRIDDQQIRDEKEVIAIRDGQIIRIGKRGFYQISH